LHDAFPGPPRSSKARTSIFIAITAAALGYGYWLVYRSSKVACVAGEACGWQGSNRLVKIGLALATVLVVVALGFDFIAPLIFKS
jgi:mercuric ion transport protein